MPRATPSPLPLAGLLALALAGSAHAGPTYLLTSGALTWAQAQAEAEALGGHLAVVNGQQEQDLLFSLFGDPDSPHGNLGGVWLGLKSVADGPYGWVTGDPFTFTNWGQGQPQGLDLNDSFAFLSVFDGKWYADEFGGSPPLNNPLFGIIEIPDDPPGHGNEETPEPATLVTVAFGTLGLLGYGWRRRG